MSPSPSLLLLLPLSFAATAGVQPRECATGEEPEAVTRTAYVMGTRLHLRVEACVRSVAAAAAEAALLEVERMDGLLSTWDPATPLSELNGARVGRTLHPEPELSALLAEAELWARRTDRAFEPAVGALVAAWDLRGEGRLPTEGELTSALEATGPGGVSIVLVGEDPSGLTPETGPPAATVTRHDPAAWLDSGGFGKGAALREAARVLRAHGVERALLDLGGQLVAVAGGDGAPWPVEVTHPGRREDGVLSLRVRDASVATSGLSERWTEVDGARLGHILDPRTGRPAPAWGSVTVVAADALAADALSTALYVLGPENGLRWARDLDDVGVLFLRDEGDAVVPTWNPAMERWLPEDFRRSSTAPDHRPSKTLRDSRSLKG